MKHRVYTLLALFFFCSTIHAQVEETMERMSQGEHTCYTITHNGADRKTVEKNFKEFMKEYGKVKHDKKKKEYYSEEADISYLSKDQPMQVFLKYEEQKGQTVSNIFFYDGSGFINSEDYPIKSEKAAKLVEEFGQFVDKYVIGEYLEDEEKKLEKLEKSLSKLEKKHRDYEDDIKNYEKKIIEAEEKIEQNLLDQDDKRYEIEKQRKQVEKVTDELNSVGNN